MATTHDHSSSAWTARLRWAAAGALATVALIALGSGAAIRAQPVPPTAAPGPRPVDVAEVEAARVARVDVLHGATTARERGRLAFTAGGRVVARPVEPGQPVSRGEVLARLDPRPLRHAADAAAARAAALDAREAQLVRDRARVDALRASGATTAQQAERIDTELQALRSERDAARAQLAERRRVLGEATLRAPYDAVVTAVFVEVGEHTAPGRPVVEVSGDGRVEVEAEAAASVAARIRPGQAVEVELPARDLVVPGTVRTVSRSGRGAGALFPVIVDLADDVAGATPGLSARVVLRHEGDVAPVVPLRAVIDPTGQRPAVFRVRDGRARRVAVELGDVGDRGVVVRAGLAAGDSVVVAGQAHLLDGDAVTARRPERAR